MQNNQEMEMEAVVAAVEKELGRITLNRGAAFSQLVAAALHDWLFVPTATPYLKAVHAWCGFYHTPPPVPHVLEDLDNLYLNLAETGKAFAAALHERRLLNGWFYLLLVRDGYLEDEFAPRNRTEYTAYELLDQIVGDAGSGEEWHADAEMVMYALRFDFPAAIAYRRAYYEWSDYVETQTGDGGAKDRAVYVELELSRTAYMAHCLAYGLFTEDHMNFIKNTALADMLENAAELL